MTTQHTMSCPGVAGSINDCPSELLFQVEDGRNVDTGSWARQLIRIGRTFADAQTDSLLTLALSLPILDFAGPLVAAGFIAERTHRRSRMGTASAVYAPERAQLFRQLCALPIETPVILRLNSGKTVRALFQGVEEAYDEPWAVIRFQHKSKGAGRCFINEATVNRVLFLPGLNARTTEHAIGRTVSVQLGLAEGFLTDDFACRELILQSASECVIIGVVKTLTKELCEAKLGVCNGGDYVTVGTLQDMVRASNFVRTDEQFRTKLFRIAAEVPETAHWNPALAIFRGSSAYLNQSSRFPRAHHVALISPTEHNFEAAILELNEAFVRKLDDIPDHGWAIPEGAAAMGFQRPKVAGR